MAIKAIQYKICEICGQGYKPGRGDSMYCSDACKQKAYRRRVDPEVGSIHREKQRQTNIAITKQMTTKELDCAVCGRHLHVSINHTNLAYCSNACKQKAYRARRASKPT
jgi:ferredoxin